MESWRKTIHEAFNVSREPKKPQQAQEAILEEEEYIASTVRPALEELKAELDTDNNIAKTSIDSNKEHALIRVELSDGRVFFYGVEVGERGASSDLWLVMNAEVDGKPSEMKMAMTHQFSKDRILEDFADTFRVFVADG